MINLNHLKYFYYCAQSENLTQAAESLGITQPALSIQIKILEDSLGFKLFSRSNRQLVLTTKGKELYKYATRLFEITGEIEMYLQNIEFSEELNLRVGVSDEVERPFVAEVAGRLMKSNQGRKMSICIHSHSHEEVSRKLRDGNLDVIITNKEIKTGFRLILKLTTPVLIAAVGSGSEATVQGGVNPSRILSILDRDLILPDEELVLGKETKQFLRRYKIRKHVAISTNILSCILRSVQEDAGVAFLPAIYINKEIQKGAIRVYGPLQGFWSHTLYVYVSKDESNGFAEQLGKVMQNLNVLG